MEDSIYFHDNDVYKVQYIGAISPGHGTLITTVYF